MKTNSYKPGSERALAGTSCPKCGGGPLHRVKRYGFLQVKFWPIFGYYPWECTGCRKTSMLNNRGERKRKRSVEARDPV